MNDSLVNGDSAIWMKASGGIKIAERLEDAEI